MTALAAFALFGAQKLLRLACVNAAFAMEIFGGIDDAFDEDLHRLKPHPGQLAVSGDYPQSVCRFGKHHPEKKHA